MKSSRLGRLAADLLGRSDRQLIDAVVAQTRAALEGIAIARAMSEGQLTAKAARRDIARAEHEGDEARAEVVAALSVTLAAPIDREDLNRLSRCLDDVLDSVRDFVRESHLYGAGPRPNVVPALESLHDGVAVMGRATASLLTEPRAVAAMTLAAKKEATRVRRSYQEALAGLFSGPFEMHALTDRELLRRLDIAGIRLGEAADVLADALVKRGR